MQSPEHWARCRLFLIVLQWEGREFPEKEVTVYYRVHSAGLVVLTAKARYGVSFPRKGGE